MRAQVEGTEHTVMQNAAVPVRIHDRFLPAVEHESGFASVLRDIWTSQRARDSAIERRSAWLALGPTRPAPRSSQDSGFGLLGFENGKLTLRCSELERVWFCHGRVWLLVVAQYVNSRVVDQVERAE